MKVIPSARRQRDRLGAEFPWSPNRRCVLGMLGEGGGQKAVRRRGVRWMVKSRGGVVWQRTGVRRKDRGRGIEAVGGSHTGRDLWHWPRSLGYSHSLVSDPADLSEF